jgi:hypothetical protein
MPLLTKAQALRVEGRLFKEVFVEELGGDLRLGSLSAGAALQLKEMGVEIGAASKKLALVVFASSIVNEKNEPLFDEEEASKWIDTISVVTLRFIIGEVMSLTAKTKGISKEAGKQLEQASNGATEPEAPLPNPSKAAPSDASPSV